MARRKSSDCPTCRERRELERDRKRQSRHAKRFNLVQKILQGGRRNLTGAVSEAAEALGLKSTRQVWDAINERKLELERQALELERQAKAARKSARDIRIALGEEEPTEEEMQEAADQWAGLLTDLARGK
jgi:hypothetical protein